MAKSVLAKYSLKLIWQHLLVRWIGVDLLLGLVPPHRELEVGTWLNGSGCLGGLVAPLPGLFRRWKFCVLVALMFWEMQVSRWSMPRRVGPRGHRRRVLVGKWDRCPWASMGICQGAMSRGGWCSGA